MSKPAPIIQTRIPAELQQIFLKSNRGEDVHVPPSDANLCRLWEPQARKEVRKKVASFGFLPVEPDQDEAPNAPKRKGSYNDLPLLEISVNDSEAESQRSFTDNDSVYSEDSFCIPNLNRWDSGGPMWEVSDVSTATVPQRPRRVLSPAPDRKKMPTDADNQ